jgi:hypothetical protein
MGAEVYPSPGTPGATGATGPTGPAGPASNGIGVITGDLTTPAASSPAQSVAGTLASVGTAGTYGSASLIPVITTDAKGRVTSVTTAAPAAGPGTQLAIVRYASGTGAIYNFVAGTLTALDTVNLTIAFTVPASGKISVRASFTLQLEAATASAGTATYAMVGLLNHLGGATIGDTNMWSVQTQVAGVDDLVIQHCVYEGVMSGLTPGALQLDLAGYYVGPAPKNCYINSQGLNNTNGSPVVLTVFAQ